MNLKISVIFSLSCVLLDYLDWHQQESSTEVYHDLKTLLLWIVNSTFILFASSFNLFYICITDLTFSDYEHNATTFSEI